MYIKTSNQERMDLGFRQYVCNWGVHIAGLYETESERDEIIMGFLHKGAENGDLQLYCPTERTTEDFISQFSGLCPKCQEYVADDNVFQLFSTRELYYPDGTFSPLAMDIGLKSFYEASQKNGKRNIRATAEMIWALEGIPGREHLMAYESRLNYFIPNKPWISICLYNLRKFNGSTIMDVLRTHPYTISKGILTENPYFQDPNVWIADNAPQFLPENTSS